MAAEVVHLDAYSVAQSIDAAISDNNSAFSEVTAAYTLQASDAGTTVFVNDASGNALTVPENVFEQGDVVRVVNVGAGLVTLTAGSGLTLHALVGEDVHQYGVATIVFVSPTVAVTTGGTAS